jgi:hypothetical protein
MQNFTLLESGPLMDASAFVSSWDPPLRLEIFRDKAGWKVDDASSRALSYSGGGAKQDANTMDIFIELLF